MALEGNLKDFSLPDILQLIGLQRKSGELCVKASGDQVIMGFDKGRLVMARSRLDPPDTRLGYIMVRSGRLTQEDVDEAMQIQKESPQSLGEILLKMGACSVDELITSQTIQFKRVLFSVFRQHEGEFIFDTEIPIEYNSELVRPIEIDMLLMEAAQILDEWPIVEKAIKSADMIFRKKNHSQAAFVTSSEDEDLDALFDPSAGSGLRLGEREARVYQMVDGERSVSDILSQAFLSEFDCYKALYNLSAQGLIEEAPSGTHEFEVIEDQPSLEDFIQGIKDEVTEPCLETVRAIPRSVMAQAFVTVITISTGRIVGAAENRLMAELPEPLLKMVERIKPMCGPRTGAFECVTENLGMAFFWDYESDYLLAIANAVSDTVAIARFRSGVARIARQMMPEG